MADKGYTGSFSPRRLYLLLKRDLISGYKGLLITMAAVGGLVLLSSVLSMLSVHARGADFYSQFYLWLLVLGGFIYTSSVFKELHQNGSGIFYVTLPGSTLEKFVSKLLVSSVGFGVGSAVFMTVVAALAELINTLIFGTTHLMFNPLSPPLLQALAAYLVTQSCYLVGSVWFRRLALLKTVLAVNVISVVLTIWTALVVRVAFGWLFDGLALKSQAISVVNNYFHTLFPNPQAAMELLRHSPLMITVRVLFWACLAPVMWVVSYVRLRETEV